jgi:Protein of unknown function (DUF2934)
MAQGKQQKFVDPVVSDQSGRQMPIDPFGTNAPIEQEIRLKAYEIYERRGRAEGQALDHWLEAERQLK